MDVSMQSIVEVLIEVTNGLVMTLEEDKRFLWVWLLYLLYLVLCEQFCRFVNEGAKISINSVLLHEIILFSVYSAVLKCWAKMLLFGVKCRLQPAGLGNKREESVKPTCFMSKATSVPQTNHSQYSSTVA